jgi:hypothetical protein
LSGFESIHSGMQSVMLAIEALMAMERQQPDPEAY